MFLRLKNIVILSLFFLGFSCSEYQDALKSEDVKVKYELAEKLYKKGDFKRSNRLFEQIVPSYIGRPQGERLIYQYANSFYQLKDYYLASYQFERFTKSYPDSEKAQEAAFLSAKSYYFTSPKYSIDQTQTVKAISELQEYINSYPNSEYLSEANKMVRELRTKLEKKAFEIAKQYNKLKDYNASITALDNFLLEYPGTPFREDALFYKLDGSYKLAIKSVPSKIQERLEDAKNAYETLKKYYSNTKYNEEAERMNASIENQLNKLSK